MLKTAEVTSFYVGSSLCFVLFKLFWWIICALGPTYLHYLHSKLLCLIIFLLFFNVSQGVRTKTVKKSARVIIEKYYQRLTMDFHTNKRIAEEVAIIPSKRMRNRIAGFVTHLMKRIAKGPVRGISLKLQDEALQKRLDLVPAVSVLDKQTFEVDADTKAMLTALNFDKLPGLQVLAK
jgi:small subunit ribosomal protein S17e